MPLVLKQFRYAWTEHALLRFSQIPYEECNINVPFCAATGEYPQLQDDTVLLPKTEILSHILQKNEQLNIGLTEEQQADSAILISMVQNTLSLFLSYRRWLNDGVFNSITYPSYMQIVPFPLSFYCLYQGKYDAKHLLAMHGLSDYYVIYQKAAEIYKALDTKLGEHPFLFGSSPCAADAVLFGHLAEALIEPIGIHDIIVRHCQHLLHYVDRIIKCYFSVHSGKQQQISHNLFLTRLGMKIKLFPTSGNKEDTQPENETDPQLSKVLSFVVTDNNEPWDTPTIEKKEPVAKETTTAPHSNSIWLISVGLLTGAFIIYSNIH